MEWTCSYVLILFIDLLIVLLLQNVAYWSRKIAGNAKTFLRLFWFELISVSATLGLDCLYLYVPAQVWSAYKDQKHDLFLPSNAQSAAAGVAGLIEHSSSRLTYALTAPPPQASKLPSAAAADSNGEQHFFQS